MMCSLLRSSEEREEIFENFVFEFSNEVVRRCVKLVASVWTANISRE